MVTVNDIGTQPPAYQGEPPRGTTWATVRAPVWNTSGLVANPTNPFLPPSSNNWSPTVRQNFGDPNPKHDARYMEPLTGFRKAFPVSVNFNSPESPTGAFSTCLGVYSKALGGTSGYDIYLALGTGIAIGTQYTASVYNTYAVAPGTPDAARTGYDYETTKAHLLGATVNLSYTTAVSTATASVVITSALFPADMFDSTNAGIFIRNESFPVDSCYVSSVVLP